MEEEKIRYYEFGEFRLDSKRRILFKNGEQISLTGRLFDILLVLVQSDGRVLEHEELLDKVWGETFVEQSNLKKGISSLRHILGENPNESIYIKTIPRRGYSFIAEVLTETDDSGFFFVKQPERLITVEEKIVEEKISKPKVEIIEPKVGDIPQISSSSNNNYLQKYKFHILATACLLIFAAAIFGIWQFRQGNVSAENFRLENLKIQKMTTSGNIVDTAISPDGKTLVYATFGENKQQTLWAKRIGSPNALQIVAPLNAKYQAIAISPDNNYVFYSIAVDNSDDYLYKVPILGGTPRKITENISSSVTFSPDGKKIAFVRDTKNVARVLITSNAEDGSDEKEIRTVSDNHTMINPIWSPDGKKIAFVSSESSEKGRIWMILETSIEGGEPTQIVAPRRGKIHIFDWLRDGKGFVICADPNDSLQSQLWFANYPSGEMMRLTNDILTYQGIDLGADGNSILTIQNERTGDLWSMNYSLLQNSDRLTDTQSFVGRFSVAPDGRILAETNENGQRGLSFINADGINVQQLFPQTSAEQSPVISQDGKNIYFVSSRSGTPEIWQTDSEGRNAKKLSDEKTFLTMLKLSPDERQIYFGIYDAIRWRLAKMPIEGGKAEFVTEETLGAFDFSSDGKFLAHSFFDRQSRNWKIAVRNLADNSTIKQFDAAAFDFIKWTRDGKNLIYTLPEIPREGGSLWSQPIDGGSPKLVLDAKDDKVLWADWSPDGQKLYFTKGKTVSNIVLITTQNRN